MCLMCEYIGRKLVEKADKAARDEESAALASLLKQSREVFIEEGINDTECTNESCIECETRDSVEEWGFFCSEPCMTTYDNRVRSTLRAERDRLSRHDEHLPNMVEFMRDSFKSVNPKYYV
jgi:hypothetical protein